MHIFPLLGEYKFYSIAKATHQFFPKQSEKPLENIHLLEILYAADLNMQPEPSSQSQAARALFGRVPPSGSAVKSPSLLGHTQHCS